MKDQAFRIIQYGFRFFYFLPRGVRRLWRTLLDWGRVFRIYHQSGMEGLRRFQSVRGLKKDNLRRKSSLGKDSNHIRFPHRG